MANTGFQNPLPVAGNVNQQLEYGHINNPVMNQDCGMNQAGSNQQVAINNNMQGMQMSPSCNQVTSTTDAKKNKEEAEPQFNDLMASNLNSISTENLIDNLSSISMETINGGNIMSPTALMNRSASQTSSRMTTPYTDGKLTSHSNASYLDTSNMVVNDMGSVLTQLAEENRYLGMR